MKTKDITPAQYANIKGCTLANITKHIRNGNALKLPFVVKLKNWSRFYLLEVPESLTDETYKEYLIKYKNQSLKSILQEIEVNQLKRRNSTYNFQNKIQ